MGCFKEIALSWKEKPYYKRLIPVWFYMTNMSLQVLAEIAIDSRLVISQPYFWMNSVFFL